MLSDAKCRNVKPTGKNQKLSDGGGLYLLVLASGGKSWRLAYRFGGKQKALMLGRYPAVSLAQARAARDNAKAMLAAHKDPGSKEVTETFEAIALRWHATNKSLWVKAHAERVLARIDRDVLPEIGHRPIGEIEPAEIVALLRKVEERGALDISKRLRQSIGAVFRFAIAEGKAKSNPAADVGDALKPKPKVKHFASLKAEAIPDLVKAIHTYDGEDRTRLALLLTLHTFVRTNETRFARWSEIEGLDGDAPLWRIPKERMKMGREHLVPLSPQVVAILRELRPLSDEATLFGGMSQNTMIFALYRMGYHGRLTVHGFRSMASTVLNEHGWNRDWIELQLAHAEENEVRGAYNAAEYLSGRREMMRWWSDYLSPAIHSSTVDSRQRTDCPPTLTGRGKSPSAILR